MCGIVGLFSKSPEIEESLGEHLAAMLGLPTLALFGPTDPATWAPRGPHVRVLRHEPLAELTPRAVLAALRDLIV